MAIRGLPKALLKDLYYSWAGLTTLRLARAAAGLDRAVYRRYCRENEVRKLHIGCWKAELKGWLNCDIVGLSRDVFFLDATRRFPFAADEFTYAFCEHMIEHIPYAAGAGMAAEVYRVLKPGGKFRLVTPSLEFLLGLVRGPGAGLERQYVEHWVKEWLPEAPTPRPAFWINHYVRAWGHQFIYDEPTLTELLRRAGFRDVTKVELGRSEDPALTGIEHPDRQPPGFLALESLALEATK
jgi:predicted SAM-dependent methyltransferase